VQSVRKKLHALGILKQSSSTHAFRPVHCRPVSRRRHCSDLRFAIDRQGRLVKSAIIRGSGYPALDQSALETLQRAQLFHGNAHIASAPMQQPFVRT